MNTILNISTYKFVPVADTEALRERCLNKAQALELKGTLLIAEEGINLFLAGTAQAVRSFVAFLQEDPRFADLQPKANWSAAQPFRQILVKVKRENIRMHPPPNQPPPGPPL